MKNILEMAQGYIHKKLMPPQFAGDLDKQKIHSSYISLSIVMIVTLIIFSIYKYHIGLLIAVYINILHISITLLLLIFNKRIKSRVLYHYTLIATIIFLLLHQVYSESFFLHVNIWVTYLPVAAAVLLGARWIFPYSIIIAFSFVLSALCAHSFDYKKIYFLTKDQTFAIDVLAIVMVLIIGTFFTTYIQRRMKEKRRELEEKAQETQTLVSILTHDISNALSIIKMNSDQLNKKLDTLSIDRQKLYIERIGGNIGIMEEIIRDVKIAHSINMGKSQHVPQIIDIKESFAGLEQVFTERLKEKNITLCFDFNHETKYLVKADQTLISNNILVNLLSNAVKFSYPNSKITIALSHQDDNVVLKVLDNGVGIPGEILANIFHSNKITSRLGTANERGTGFGMPIVKQLLERFNAQIVINSRPEDTNKENHGTDIIITFPVIKN